MCTHCQEAADKAMARGVSDDAIMEYLWERTRFPVGDPTDEQLKYLAEELI